MSEFRVLFVYPNQRAESLVPPAIATFSRLLKDRGIKVGLFDSSYYDIDADDYAIKPGGSSSELAASQLLHARPYESRAESNRKHEDAIANLTSLVDTFSPDLIAMTTTESTYLLGMHLMKAIRHTGVPVLVGGVFCTFAPERAIKFSEVDMICVGEGENAIVDLCEKMRTGQDYSRVTNLWVKKKNGDIVRNSVTKPVDVNSVPMPDMEIFEEERFYRPMYGKMYKMIPVETHRGCPYTCSFCNSPSQNALYSEMTGSSFFRKRSLKNVHEDLLHYRDVLKGEYIYFWADTFFAYSNREFDAFCEMYQDIGLPFWCQTRPETVSRDKIKKLKDVGLHFIAFGMEHGNEKFRAEVVERKYSNDLAIDAMRIPHEYGVPFSLNNIIGFPDETRELSFDTIRINRAADPDQMSCSILQAYAGTNLHKVAIDKGYLDPTAFCPANSDDTLMTMPSYSREEMKGIRRTFAMYVKFPESRWPEIERAEKLTPEGDAIWAELASEFSETFFKTPNTDITRQGNPQTDADTDRIREGAISSLNAS
jgi:anaerobic magnesium-protoporphyrin IX monomethyl ester cyclase